MALFETRGFFRRCANCDSAVAEDAVACAACGEALSPAGRGGEGHRSPERPMTGSAGGGLRSLAGLGSGTSGAAAAAAGFVRGLGQSLGEAAVKILGLKTGEAAVGENPFAREPSGAGALFRRRLYAVTFPWRTGLRDVSLVGVYLGLARYAEAGVGFHDALGRVEKSQTNAAMRRILREIREDLLEGATLAAAFGRHEYLFDPLHVALIEVGESLGTVADNMRTLVEVIEERRAMRDAIARRLVQPIALIFIANYVLTLPVLLFGGLLGYLSVVLPPTLFFAFVAFAVVFLLPVLGTAIGRRTRDRILLELPAFGTVARTNALSRFARAMGAALGAGCEVGKSLRLSARATGNAVVEEAVLAALPFVKERGLAEGLERGGILTSEVAADLAHAEASGAMTDAFARIAKDSRDRAARGIAILGGIFSSGLLVATAVYAVLRTMTTVFGMISSGLPGLPGSGPVFDPFNDPRLPRG